MQNMWSTGQLHPGKLRPISINGSTLSQALLWSQRDTMPADARLRPPCLPQLWESNCVSSSNFSELSQSQELTLAFQDQVPPDSHSLPSPGKLCVDTILPGVALPITHHPPHPGRSPQTLANCSSWSSSVSAELSGSSWGGITPIHSHFQLASLRECFTVSARSSL